MKRNECSITRISHWLLGVEELKYGSWKVKIYALQFDSFLNNTKNNDIDTINCNNNSANLLNNSADSNIKEYGETLLLWLKDAWYWKKIVVASKESWILSYDIQNENFEWAMWDNLNSIHIPWWTTSNCSIAIIEILAKFLWKDVSVSSFDTQNRTVNTNEWLDWLNPRDSFSVTTLNKWLASGKNDIDIMVIDLWDEKAGKIKDRYLHVWLGEWNIVVNSTRKVWDNIFWKIIKWWPEHIFLWNRVIGNFWDFSMSFSDNFVAGDDSVILYWKVASKTPWSDNLIWENKLFRCKVVDWNNVVQLIEPEDWKVESDCGIWQVWNVAIENILQETDHSIIYWYWKVWPSDWSFNKKCIFKINGETFEVIPGLDFCGQKFWIMNVWTTSTYWLTKENINKIKVRLSLTDVLGSKSDIIWFDFDKLPVNKEWKPITTIEWRYDPQTDKFEADKTILEREWINLDTFKIK
jgi:hypothetical protein